MFENVEAFYRPESVPEALRLLERSNGEARVLAGGAADLAGDGGLPVRFLIDLTSAGLSYIRKRESVCLIGAATTLADLDESTAIGLWPAVCFRGPPPHAVRCRCATWRHSAGTWRAAPPPI